VIDPDERVRAAVQQLALAMNLACETYASGRDFFAADGGSLPGCLVSEVKMPDMSGLQIQRRLAASGPRLPIIFLTAHDDLSLAVTLMRGGASHYLLKPFRPLDVINAIQEAIAQDRSRRRAAERRRRVLEGVAGLTAKERDILRLIAKGMTNHAMSTHLAVSLRTVELRRASLSTKLNLPSPAALVEYAILAKRHALHYLNGADGASRDRRAASRCRGGQVRMPPPTPQEGATSP